MKTQHTPGEWEIDNRTLYRGEEMIIDEYGKYVAGVHQRDDKGEEKANAKLIAAAPEMLEALISIVDALKQFEGEYNEYGEQRVLNAEAVIKKATE